jgi:hypothetical protein
VLDTAFFARSLSGGIRDKLSRSTVGERTGPISLRGRFHIMLALARWPQSHRRWLPVCITMSAGPPEDDRVLRSMSGDAGVYKITTLLKRVSLAARIQGMVETQGGLARTDTLAELNSFFRIC